MCNTIVIERKYLVKAVNQFKQLYPVAASDKPAMKWARAYVRDARVQENSWGTFTILRDPKNSKSLPVDVIGKACACAFAKPCSHRIAINLAKIAIAIRAADSEYQVSRTTAQPEFAETRGLYYVASPEGRQAK